ncbi:response regulator [Desulfatirhabdium butyrativorans]|uniref:response regulator n=1 Tax=Desulfatirhabdium butyrativorans TaxID=340467 RepID=UPI0003F4BC2C|nr:response regulator [Desulfatirhabdium butyrativorans]
MISDPAPCESPTSGIILFADDEPLLRDVASQMIQKLGFQVLTASTGREAIRLFQEHHDNIRVVILDMMMPDWNGAETFNKLQAIDPDVSILICSGFTREIMPELLAKGCKGFLQKPFTMADLKLHILKAMNEPISAV